METSAKFPLENSLHPRDWRSDSILFTDYVTM